MLASSVPNAFALPGGRVYLLDALSFVAMIVALSHLAIDRPALAEIAMEGLGRAVNQMVTPGIFGL